MIIYKITNTVNGKIYIGQTKWKLEKRFRYHTYNCSGCVALRNALYKYGVENFTIEEIDCAESQSELDEKETYWIKHYNCIVPNGYNLKNGGSTPTYSEESKIRMSKNHADVSGMNNPRYGSHVSEEHKQKLRLSLIILS